MINVIVTGGLGFIGSNFISKLLSLKNYKILNIDNVSYSSNLEINKLLKKIQIIFTKNIQSATPPFYLLLNFSQTIL